MQYKRAQRGDSFAENLSAEAWNAMLDAGRAHRERRDPRGGPVLESSPHQLRIEVRNETGLDLGRFEVVGLGAPLIDIVANPNEWAARPAFVGDFPAALHEGRFAVLVQPLAQGKIGEAVVAGFTPARVVIDDVRDEFCDVAAGSTFLYSSPVGSAQIVWHQGIVGEQWAMIRLSEEKPSKAFVAKTGGSPISALSGNTPGSGVVTLYRLVSGVLQSTGRTLTVWNMAGEVAANAWIQIKQDAFGVWWIDVEKC